MTLKILVMFGVVMLGCSTGGTQDKGNQEQTKGKPDQSVSEARKTPPFPPKGVSVESENKHTTVTWDPIPLDNIVAYKVYRKTGESKFVLVGTVKHPPFIDDNAPSGATSYTVTAVNTYQAESSFAVPAKK